MQKNISLKEISLQKDECSDIKIVDIDKYNLMCKNNEMVPHLNYFYEIYKSNNNERK